MKKAKKWHEMISRYEKESESRVYIDFVDNTLHKRCCRNLGMGSVDNDIVMFTMVKKCILIK